MASQRREPKLPSEEQAAPDDNTTENRGVNDDQTIVLIELKPGEPIGCKVNKELGVMQVNKNGACDQKFAVGDVITHVDEKPITSLKQWEDTVAKGGSFQVNVNRGLKSDQNSELPPEREKFVNRREGYLYQLVTIEHQRGCKFGLGIKHYQNKVIVSRVDDGTLSAKSLVAGDRIIDINGQPVSDKDVARDLLLKSLQKTKKVSLVVERACSDDALAAATAALVASEMQPPSIAMASDVRDIIARQKAKGSGTGAKKSIMRKSGSTNQAQMKVQLVEDKKEHIIASDNEGKALKKVAK
jgi:S1-C subfamily serine protease